VVADGSIQTGDRVHCPQCHGTMRGGFVAIEQGLRWVRRSDAGQDFVEHVPGTHAVMRANRLPAWRCTRCKLITFRYGEQAARQPEPTRPDALPDAPGG
jgi:hypothetical protein